METFKEFGATMTDEFRAESGRLLIDDRTRSLVEPFLEVTLSTLEDSICKRTLVRCVRCGHKIELPIVASQEDVEAFEALLSMASEWLEENGVIERMLTELASKIKSRLNIQ